MMDPAAFGVGLGQDDAVAGDLVDGADMFVVAADNFHMFADGAEQAALLLPLFAPAAELAFEARLVLAAVVVIVAVKLAKVSVAPAAIVRVETAFAVAKAALAAVKAAGGEILSGFMLGPAVVAGHRAIVAAAV